MDTASQVDISKALFIPGWMSERELIWLAERARECERIVEFGSYLGRSTRALADNCIGKVWAVDPWNGDYFAESGKLVNQVDSYSAFPHFKVYLYDHIAADSVIPIRNFSSNFKLDEKVDMVFIDGDHRYFEVVKDINKAIELLKPNGLLCGHDYGFDGWPGVRKAVDERFKVGVEDTIWWTRVN